MQGGLSKATKWTNQHKRRLFCLPTVTFPWPLAFLGPHP